MTDVNLGYDIPATIDAHLKTLQIIADVGDGKPAVIEYQAPWFQTRQDTFTATGNGVAVDAKGPLSRFAMQVKGTGAVPTSWDVRIEGSLDGVNYEEIFRHTNSDNADGSIVFSGTVQFPAMFFRSRCAALSLGSATNIVVTILGVS